MLTPQDIQNKEFAKAVFGGYDMAAVDDFLEKLTADYTDLYKEDAILKGKIKVLVEKVEEYRSTEDAMRMALLTAQKMGDDIVQEAKKKSDEMLAQSQQEIDDRRQSFAKEQADESARLEAAKEQTVRFVQASREIMTRHSDFLSRLDEITQEFGGVSAPSQEPAPAEAAETVRSPEPEPQAAAPAAPAAENAPLDDDAMADTIRDIDACVAGALGDGAAPAAPAAAAQPASNVQPFAPAAAPAQEAAAAPEADEPAAPEDIADEPTKRIDFPDDDEPVTPRPKFNFKDLKFGSHYFDE